MKNVKGLKYIVAIGVVLIIGVIIGLILNAKSKKPGEGSSVPLIDEINKVRASKNFAPLQLDENLCKFAMQRTTEYKYSQNKEETHKAFKDVLIGGQKTILSGYQNIDESVLIYERDRTPVSDAAIVEDFSKQEESPLILNPKITLGCVEEEPYENYRYFVFIGASKD